MDLLQLNRAGRAQGRRFDHTRFGPIRRNLQLPKEI
jgi:hypothetical protein